MTIESFMGDYGFLSNFYPMPFHWNGQLWQTAEHAFQAAKSDDPMTRLEIMGASTPGKAKRLGRRVDLMEGWDGKRLGIMTDIVGAKFTEKSMASKLKGTAQELLVEGNLWHDQFWGSCQCPYHVRIPGENNLGKILMRCRDVEFGTSAQR